MALLCPKCGFSNRDDARFCLSCGAPVQFAPVTGALPANAVLQGRYLVVKAIGRGGMGAVYEAVDNVPGSTRRWAIKEMSDSAIEAGERAKAIDNFRREAELLATLTHSNLPKALPPFFENGKWYFAMDFIQGRTLDSVLARSAQALPEPTVMSWAEQLCDVLTYLHGQVPPIIFRDLKPANVMVEDMTGCIKLIDFGIARFFKPGKAGDTQIMGTPGYAAPEQYGKGQTDARSDVYSLAAMLYHLLTADDPGSHPFQFGDLRALNPRLSDRVVGAIGHALQPDPGSRPQSAADFKLMLLSSVPLAQPVAHAFYFRNGTVAQTVTDLVRLADRQWEDAKYHLYNGDFALWLQATAPQWVAPAQSLVRRYPSQDAGLEEFLHLLDPSLPAPILAVYPTFVDLGEVTGSARKNASLEISNHGRGYLQGQVQTSVPWLAVQPAGFTCLPGQTHRAEVTAAGGSVAQSLHAELKITSNGGEKTVGVHALLSRNLLFARSGVVVADLAAFVQAAAAHREDAKRLLYSGELEKWLKEVLLRFDLVSQAEGIRRQGGDQDRGLTDFLKAVDPGSLSRLPAIPSVDKTRVDLRSVQAGQPSQIHRVKITNVGGSTLQGRVTASSPWIQVKPTTFSGSEAIIEVSANTRGMQGNRTYSDNVVIEAAGYRQEIGVEIHVLQPPLNQAAHTSRNLALWGLLFTPLELVAFFMALKGLNQEKITPTDKGKREATTALIISIIVMSFLCLFFMASLSSSGY